MSKCRILLETIARMSTPYDDMEHRKAAYAKSYNLDPADVGEDDVLSDYPGDDAIDDANALWSLIREARTTLREIELPDVTDFEHEVLRNMIREHGAGVVDLAACIAMDLAEEAR